MLKFKRITKNNISSNEKKQLKNLYLNAFPAEEQLPFFFLIKQTKKKNVDFLSIYDDQTWIGFIYIIKHDDIAFISYFAIDNCIRSKGYGSKILSEIKRQYSSYTICLTFEKIDSNAKNNSQRIKRKEFYSRNNFNKFNFYIKEAGVMYEFISHDHTVKAAQYLDLKEFYFGKFLNYFFKDKIYR